MSTPISIMIDGADVQAMPGQTILEAAEAAGIYVPRLCHKKGLEPFGGCRVCTVLANGRPCSACTQPVSPGMIVQNESEKLKDFRKTLVEMMFVEGNHFCMFCEKSGNCELQAMGYRMGIDVPRFPFLFPKRDVDASHPDILVDHNRCILCARCIRTSRDVDGKQVFDFVGRGVNKRVAVRTGTRLADSEADVSDAAVEACPVGALLKKRVGYATPIGRRTYDHAPIGSDIENGKEA